MFNRPMRRWLVLGLCLVAGPSLGKAQTAAASPSPAPDVEEIVVSATRIPTPEEETGASVSVIDADDFANKQNERVGDALRQVPGLSIVQTGTP
ncbi:MAG: TonB-dependent receptor plug domain-containing protein, partial [Chthoniobacterales bacterium]